MSRIVEMRPATHASVLFLHNGTELYCSSLALSLDGSLLVSVLNAGKKFSSIKKIQSSIFPLLKEANLHFLDLKRS